MDSDVLAVTCHRMNAAFNPPDVHMMQSKCVNNTALVNVASACACNVMHKVSMEM